jgi:hypothetical protein
MKHYLKTKTRCALAIVSIALISGCAMVQHPIKNLRQGSSNDSVSLFEFSRELSRTLPVKVAILPVKKSTIDEKSPEPEWRRFDNQFASGNSIGVDLVEIVISY